MTFGQQAWFSIWGNDPDPLFGFFRLAARVRVFAEAFQIPAASEHERLPVWRPGQLADLYTVIFIVRSELSPLVIGRLGNPDIPHALCVQHPGDFAAGWSGS